MRAELSRRRGRSRARRARPRLPGLGARDRRGRAASSASSGIGTNSGIDRATGHILLDEKIAGTVHLALGRSYPETGGTNASALHWDLICDLREGGRLSADGEPIVQDGRIVVESRNEIPSFGNRRRDSVRYRMRRTKIVATIGPASRDREIARAHGRGRDRRRAAQLLPRRPRDPRRERRARPRRRGRGGPPGRDPAGSAGPEAPHRRAQGRASPSSSRATCSCCCAGSDATSVTARAPVGHLGRARRGRRPGRRDLPRRRCDPPARHDRARRRRRDRDGGRDRRRRSPRARASTSPARRAGWPPCRRRTSTCCASASRSASTSWRCRSCAPPRT